MKPLFELGSCVDAYMEAAASHLQGHITATRLHRCPCGCAHVYITYTVTNVFGKDFAGIHERHLTVMEDKR